MDSPSAQLVEPSMIDFDQPSSPFVTEVDNNSRSPSKQWRRSTINDPVEDQIAMSPSKHVDDFEENKENELRDEGAVPSQIFTSPKKPSSTPEKTAGPIAALTSSQGSNLMLPPQSTRKASESPRKTPRKLSRSGANTPRSISRGNSFEFTPSAQNAANFQAALDVRNAMMPAEDQNNMDDTCFSTFSEIPDMTTFAKLGQNSPTKRGDLTRTPRGNADAEPGTSRKRSYTSRSPSPTPRRQKTPGTITKRDETGSFLIDFTQQFDGVANVTTTSPSKSQTESNLLQYINNQRSPAKNKSRSNCTTPNKSKVLNLLDFELPPAPTPRSVPTITVRELESLKSSYLSQISSLKATLSGREAEVDSLKKAVGDAERRVGEAQESLRDEKSKREYLEQENESWKKRGVEFESVLKSVKEEVLKSEAEKEETSRKLEDAEKRVEDAEARAVKAEERFADALAARAGGEGGDANAVEEQVQRLVSAQIDAKIESVSRELHAVYKEKHERKVATLKKSYEARNEKKTSELQARVTELEKANDELQAAKDATFSGPVRGAGSDSAELKAQLEEQNAAIARLESEMQTSKAHQEKLESELKQERIEKGDLVAAVDEMLALQAEAPPPATPQGVRAMSVVEDFRKSIRGPPSGLRAPGGSGIPAGPTGLRGPQAGLNRSTSGGAGKSRMLANIERMGRTGSSNAMQGIGAPE